jgi:signal transduction histidine kinase
MDRTERSNNSVSGATEAPVMPESANLPRRLEAEDAQVRRAVTILMGMAAHDLRTPLSAMSGWLQVLTSGRELPAATRESALKGLRTAVTQQIMLADGLSQLAAIETGMAPTEPSIVDVWAAARATAAALAEEADSRLVDLRVTQRETPVRIASDPHLVEMLLRYLFAGALKFAAKNSLMAIAVESCTAGPGCEIRIEIGASFLPAAGIDALLQHLRGVGGAEPTGTGAAFALAVAQRVILFLDGTLKVEAGAAPQQVTVIARLPASAAKPE